MMRVLSNKDILALLKSEIKRAGSISAWSKKHGLPRTVVSKVVNESKPPTRTIAKALKLRSVWVKAAN